MQRRRFLAATGGAMLSLIAGCSGNGGGGGMDTGTPTPTQTSTPTSGGTTTDTQTGTSAQEQYPDYNWGKLDDASPVGTSTVTLRNTSFNPLIAAVTPGTEVTFTNEDSFGHTVTIPKVGVDRQIAAGESTAVTFDELGTYDYVCTVHPPDMLGRIEVTDNPPEATMTTTATDGETTTEETGGTETTTDGGGYY